MEVLIVEREKEKDAKQAEREERQIQENKEKRREADVTRVSDTDKPPPRRTIIRNRDDEHA